MHTIIQLLQVLIDAVTLIVLVQVILSLLVSFNVINTYNEFIRAIYTGLNRGTDPLYRPLRRVLPDFGALDLAPFAVLLILRLISIVL
ncbi:YggT family protein, partial [Pseudomonas proteolytica]|uniref:YggT family protein n=2 Tax=Pseudomonadota TaxID=1224 RepID=UPI0030D9E1A5